MRYKFTDQTNSIVSKIDDDGKSRSSCSVDAIAEWIAAGNTPEPADPPPPPTQDQLDIIEAKQHAKLVALSKMTPAQVQTWILANVTNLAQAQDAIATLAIAVSILARRL